MYFRFMDDVMFSYDVVNGPESSTVLCLGGGTSWTSDNYNVWLNSSEYGIGGEVCYLQLHCLEILAIP